MGKFKIFWVKISNLTKNEYFLENREKMEIFDTFFSRSLKNDVKGPSKLILPILYIEIIFRRAIIRINDSLNNITRSKLTSLIFDI